MEDFPLNNTSQDKSFKNSNITFSDPNEHPGKVHPMFVVTCMIIAIGLLLTLISIYAVYSLVRKDRVVPIYVINLLISDLSQFCCLILSVTNINAVGIVIGPIYICCLTASVCFMVCIALERYLVIACPLWYRSRHTIKFSVVLCVMVWILSPVLWALTFLAALMLKNIVIVRIIVPTFLLLPIPLLIFFLGGTIRALSASRVPSDEKRRIVGILVLVLLIYTLLVLPAIILITAKMTSDHHLTNLAEVFVLLSPLADLFLYVFMRKDTIDKLLASVCCCRMDSNDSSRMDSNDISSSTV